MTYAKNKIARKPKKSFIHFRILDVHFKGSSESILFMQTQDCTNAQTDLSIFCLLIP